MAHHELKILEKFAKKHLQGRKDWEIRKNDRNYSEGDTVTFTVLDENKVPTGQKYTRVITYFFNNPKYGISYRACIFSLATIPQYQRELDQDLDVKKFKHILDILERVKYKDIITKAQEKAIIEYIKRNC